MIFELVQRPQDVHDRAGQRQRDVVRIDHGHPDVCRGIGSRGGLYLLSQRRQVQASIGRLRAGGREIRARQLPSPRVGREHRGADGLQRPAPRSIAGGGGLGKDVDHREPDQRFRDRSGGVLRRAAKEVRGVRIGEMHRSAAGEQRCEQLCAHLFPRSSGQ